MLSTYAFGAIHNISNFPTRSVGVHGFIIISSVIFKHENGWYAIHNYSQLTCKDVLVVLLIISFYLNIKIYNVSDVILIISIFMLLYHAIDELFKLFENGFPFQLRFVCLQNEEIVKSWPYHLSIVSRSFINSCQICMCDSDLNSLGSAKYMKYFFDSGWWKCILSLIVTCMRSLMKIIKARKCNSFTFVKG